jgi:tape measure domain-containing protein
MTNLEFVVSVSDRSRAGLRSFLSGINHVTSVAGRNLRTMGQVADRAFHGIAAGAQKAQQAIGKLTSAIGTGAGIGAASLAGALALVGKTGVDMNITLGGATVALTRMTGSSRGAARLIGELRKEALQSMLTFKDMLPVAQSLVAVLGPRNLGAVVPIMRAFGDAATALQLPADSMDRALLGFRQLLGRPFAQQEELNQINENLPGANVGGILRKQFGTADTEDLAKAGVTGQMVGFAIVRGLQQAFGGSQRALGGTIPMLLSGIQDSFNDFSATVTRTFGKQIQRALSSVLDLITRMGRNRRVLVSLETIFIAIGNVVQRAAANAGNFVHWLSRIATGENIIGSLTAILALFKTIGEELLRFAGVDLKKLFDPKNINGFFNEIRKLELNTIKAFFGIGRVFQEVLNIVSEQSGSVRTFFGDLFEDMAMGGERAFLTLSLHASKFFLGVLDGAQHLARALGPAAGMFGLGAVGLQGARKGLEQNVSGTQGALHDLTFRQADVIGDRTMRDLPGMFGAKGIPRRIGDAFSGATGDRKAEIDFLKRLGFNEQELAGVFGGAGASAPSGGGPMNFASQHSGVGVATPAQVVPLPGISPNDPFGPVRVGGRTMTRHEAEAKGLMPGQGGGTQIIINLPAGASKEDILRVLDSQLNAVGVGRR